jgi:hypothetical protein
MSDVRALVLTPQDRGVIVSRLARAVLSFQDNFLSRESSPSGLLCQVWLPEVADGNEVVLKTKVRLLLFAACLLSMSLLDGSVYMPPLLGSGSECSLCCSIEAPCCICCRCQAGGRRPQPPASAACYDAS